jgi:hypothetical protein
MVCKHIHLLQSDVSGIFLAINWI